MSDPFEKFRKKVRTTHHSPEPVIEEDEEEPTAENEELPNPAVEEPEEIISKEPEKMDRVFFPKKDITAYDLARILALTELMITEDIYEKFPPDLQKYFVRFQEVKPEL